MDVSRVIGRTVAAAENRSPLQRYGLAIVLTLLAAAVNYAAFGFHRPYFPPFGLAVVLVSLFGGTRPGLLAVATALISNLVMLPPRPSLLVQGGDNLAQVVIFGFVGTIFAVVIGVSGQLQRKLDLERQRLAVSLRSIGDAVMATDASGMITFMNPVAEEATAWKLEEARGLRLEQVFRIINEDTRQTVQNPVERVLATGQIVGLANHTILVRKDGSEIPIDDSAAPIRDGEEIAGVILVFRDISGAKALQTAMLRAEKLASVGRLEATIAHEINNPLESLSNLLYLIQTTDDLSSIKRYAETAERELARAAHVTKQSLSFARQSEERQMTELAPLVNDLVSMYRNRLEGKNISVEVRVSDSACAWGNPGELRQLISNLLVNAMDAANEGGRITVRISPIWSQSAVRVLVGDTGAGISRQNLRKLFQPFFTTKKDVGTGLGLWVCRQIAESHNGKIRVRSRSGRGTVFAVTLPSKAEEDTAATA
jgi:PAS domain S-box-containing protein